MNQSVAGKRIRWLRSTTKNPVLSPPGPVHRPRAVSGRSGELPIPRGSGVRRRHVGPAMNEAWRPLERRQARTDAGKPRPAVIVQDDSFDATDSIIICAFRHR